MTLLCTGKSKSLPTHPLLGLLGGGTVSIVFSNRPGGPVGLGGGVGREGGMGLGRGVGLGGGGVLSGIRRRTVGRCFRPCQA